MLRPYRRLRGLDQQDHFVGHREMQIWSQPFDRAMLNRLLDLASGGIGELLRLQGRALG